MWFFTFVDTTWYAESAIYAKKSSFLSFYSFLMKLSEWHREIGRVTLTKCDHYVSDILFEWPHV